MDLRRTRVMFGQGTDVFVGTGEWVDTWQQAFGNIRVHLPVI